MKVGLAGEVGECFGRPEHLVFPFLGRQRGVQEIFDHTEVFFREGQPPSQVVRQALDKAAALCRDRGVRLTPIRRRVLELVWREYRPVGAYDILEVLKQEHRGAAPPTVYRALDFLLTQGLVHRIESLNAFAACRYPDKPHVAEFFVCARCGAVAELKSERAEAEVMRSAREMGFRPHTCVIEVKGVCPRC